MGNNPEYRQVTNSVNLNPIVTKIRTAQASLPKQKQMIPPKK